MTMNIKSRFFSPQAATPLSAALAGLVHCRRRHGAAAGRTSSLHNPPPRQGAPLPLVLAGAINPPPNKTLCCNI